MDSIVKENGEIAISLEFFILNAGSVEPVYFRSTIIILDKTAYSGETITVTAVHLKYVNEEAWNQAVLDGFAFNSFDTFNQSKSEKLAGDLAALEKYKP